jgi:hypothetical protein
MGKSSRTKRRASVRSARKSRGNLGWYALAAVVIVAGVVGIIFSRSSSADTAPLVNKDHWHAAIGVNVCGEWLPNAPTFEDAEGIHTHGDGLIHIHPFLSRAAGKNATVGLYFKLGGWKANQDSFTVWDGKTHKTGDKCGDKKATVRWELNGKPQSGSISDYNPQNGDIIALALLPKGEAIGQPPSASELAAPSDLNGGASVPADTGTTVPGVTPDTSATTDTTAASGATTPASTP